MAEPVSVFELSRAPVTTKEDEFRVVALKLLEEHRRLTQSAAGLDGEALRDVGRQLTAVRYRMASFLGRRKVEGYPQSSYADLPEDF